MTSGMQEPSSQNFDATASIIEAQARPQERWPLTRNPLFRLAVAIAIVITVATVVTVLTLNFPNESSQWWSWLIDRWQWVVVFALGALVGAGEIISRYNDAPERALFTVPGTIYWAINGLAAVVALLLIRASGLTFGIDPQNQGSTSLALSTIQVLVAGFGAMAFFRSSFFFANIGGQEVGVGPSTLLQTVLTASDKAVDRTRAKARARYVASVMDGVSAPKAERALPVHSIALMQNLTPELQKRFADEVRSLYDTAMNNQVRVLNLGLLIMNYMGEDVLRAAVNSLRDVIRGDTPSIEISSPGDGATYGLNETVKAAYICKGEPGGAAIESRKAPVENGKDIDTTTLGEKEFVVTAEDKNGNSHTVRHVYYVVDKDPPEIEVPNDIIVEARNEHGARVFFQPTAKDLDPPKPDVVCSRASGEYFGLGTTTVTCTAKDAAGNIAHDYFKVTVEDTTGPVLRLPPGGVIYVEAQNADGAEVNYGPAPSAIDAVDGEVEVECDPYPNSVLPIGEHTVKCWALDEAGNKTTGRFKVVVRDTTAPDLQIPEDMTMKGAGNGGVQVEYKVTANDAVDGNQVELRCDPPPGTVFPIGKTAVTCTAIDKAGNETIRSFTVTVEKEIDDPGAPEEPDAPLE